MSDKKDEPEVPLVNEYLWRSGYLQCLVNVSEGIQEQIALYENRINELKLLIDVIQPLNAARITTKVVRLSDFRPDIKK